MYKPYYPALREQAITRIDELPELDTYGHILDYDPDYIPAQEYPGYSEAEGVDISDNEKAYWNWLLAAPVEKVVEFCQEWDENYEGEEE